MPSSSARRVAGLLVLGIASGCAVARQSPSPVAVITSPIGGPAETYGAGSGVPAFQPAVPTGQKVVIPPGLAALTLAVSIPRKAANSRQAQYIDFNETSKVAVTVAGQNISQPISTMLNVVPGSSAEGTIVVPAGSNQIIEATAEDASGSAIATVQGVASTVAGRVVTAIVDYGTTPTAEVLAGLGSTEGTEASASAIQDLVTEVTSPSVSAGVVTYAHHPLFVNYQEIQSAIQALVTQGASISTISSASIYNELVTQGNYPPLYAPGAVQFDLLDPSGNPYDLPRTGTWCAQNIPTFTNSTLTGAYFGNGIYYQDVGWADGGNFGSFTVTDPLTVANFSMSQGSASLVIPTIPPGTFSYSLGSLLWGLVLDEPSGMYGLADISPKPWVVVAPPTNSQVVITPGATAVVNLQLQDVSNPVTLGATSALFISNYPYQWFRFPAEANELYYLSIDQATNSQTAYVFDQDSDELFQTTNSTDSYTYADPATSTVYVYLPSASSSATVTFGSITTQALFNGNVFFSQ